MEFVKHIIKDRRADIILCRPDKRNALHPGMVTELSAAFDHARKESKVKVVVLSAEGSVFSAGADLGYLQTLQSNSFDENLADSNRLKELFKLIYEFPKPVIARLEGHAIAGGAGLASVCDFIFATPDTKIGYTEVRIGFVPAIVSYFLIRKIGEARATSMLLSGDLYDAAECLQFGLINKIVPSDLIASEVDALSEKLISKNSGQSMESTKKLIKEVQNLSLSDALDLASRFNAEVRSTEDCKRGIDHFLNKQKMEW